MPQPAMGMERNNLYSKRKANTEGSGGDQWTKPTIKVQKMAPEDDPEAYFNACKTDSYCSWVAGIAMCGCPDPMSGGDCPTGQTTLPTSEIVDYKEV